MKLYYFYEFGYIEIEKVNVRSIELSKILNGLTGDVIETSNPERYTYEDGKIKELDFTALSARGLTTQKEEYEAKIQAKIREQAITAIKAEAQNESR